MSSCFAILVLSILSTIQCQPFSVTLSSSDYYKLGDDVTCKVVIVNQEDTDYYILRRETALEQVRADIFIVNRGKEKVKYDGLLYQRTPPTQDEYVLIPAKSSLVVTVDLSHTYPFDVMANFTVQMDSTVQYYKQGASSTSNQHLVSNTISFSMTGCKEDHKPTEAEALRRNSSSIKPLDLSLVTVPKTGASYIRPAFSGTPYGNDIQVTINVYDAVYNILPKSYVAVDSNPNNLYTTWFGIRYNGYMEAVKGTFINIKNAMEKYQFLMYFDGPECKKIKNVVAYTYKGSQVIYLCSIYRSEQDVRGVNTKLGTVLHELTHAVAYTDDITYGQSNCAALARREPNRAIQNADNYRCFTEPLLY